jgi:hypothetical protein
MPPVSLADRSILSPAVVRFLLGRYSRCIGSRYDILEPERLSSDGINLKKLPDTTKFEILMACGIAAARESYRFPHWRSFAQIARDWAGEFVAPIISTENKNSLRAILLLLVFELADPSRGLTWDLLDLATRTCLQLGWLQNPPSSDAYSGYPNDQPQSQSSISQDEQHLVSVLKYING